MPDLSGARGASEAYRVGDRVRVLLDSEFWGSASWFEGTVVAVEPYSRHRSFYWVELDGTLDTAGRTPSLISILNPKKIQRLVDSQAEDFRDTPPG